MLTPPTINTTPETTALTEETEQATTTTAPVISKFECRVPAEWNIQSTKGSDKITAYCSISGETFEGTISEFNKAMK